MACRLTVPQQLGYLARLSARSHSPLWSHLLDTGTRKSHIPRGRARGRHVAIHGGVFAAVLAAKYRDALSVVGNVGTLCRLCRC